MAITEDKLIHRIVYWPPIVAGLPGQPAYGEPVEMAGRWVPRETQVITPDGSVITTRIVVWTEIECLKNGFLLKGVIGDVVSNTVPTKTPNVYRIREIAVFPVVDGTEQVNVAYV